MKLEARLAELVKRRDHLLLVNSRLSKPFDQTSTTSGSKNSRNNEANVANNFKSPFLARTNQGGLVGKSTENAVSAVDVSKADKHDEFSKQPDPSVAQKQNEVGAAKKEHQRQKQFSENSSSIKENHQQHQQAPQQVEKRSPVKLDASALSVDERISSPSRAGKGSGEGKNAAASNSSGAGENPPSRQSPKSRKSPQSGGGGKKSKVQEQLYQQEHQKLLQQQQHHIKQQQLNRQKFQPAHLLPVSDVKHLYFVFCCAMVLFRCSVFPWSYLYILLFHGVVWIFCCTMVSLGYYIIALCCLDVLLRNCIIFASLVQNYE